MGLYLSSPCREVDAEEGTGNHLQYAVGEMQGWRSHMEDAHIACLDLGTDFKESEITEERKIFLDGIAVFGVFDGHGGKEVSLFVKNYYLNQLISQETFREGNIEAALADSFHHMDEMLNVIEYGPVLKEFKKRPSPSEMSKINSRNNSNSSIKPLGMSSIPANVAISTGVFPPSPGPRDENSGPSPSSGSPPVSSPLFSREDQGFETADVKERVKSRPELLDELVLSSLSAFEEDGDNINKMEISPISSSLSGNIFSTQLSSKNDGSAFSMTVTNDEEMTEAERIEKEEEDKYFDDVLRANTVEPVRRENVVKVVKEEEVALSEEEEEDKYFEAVLRANTECSSEFENTDEEEGIVSHGGKIPQGSEMCEKEEEKEEESQKEKEKEMTSLRGMTVIAPDFAGAMRGRRKSTNSAVTDTTAITTSSTSTSTSSKVNASALEGNTVSPFLKIRNTGRTYADPGSDSTGVVDFTESLTMEALEKGPEPTPFSPALSRSRPATSLSFRSPSSNSNPFGKDTRARSKSGDSDIKLKAELLSEQVIEKINVKKLENSGESDRKDRIDLSTFSKVATNLQNARTQNAKIQNLKRNAEEKSHWDGLSNPPENSDIKLNNSESQTSGEEENPEMKQGINEKKWPAPPPNPTHVRGIATGKPATVYYDGIPSCNLLEHRVTAGCTAVVALKKGNKLYVANAGDSRGVLCRGGIAHPLSEDHKPTQDRETKRIIGAGGFVNHVGRINGNLNVSRSLGDLKYKQSDHVGREGQMITAQPDVTVTELLPSDEFFILGCDGIWDCLTCQEACDLVGSKLKAGVPPMKVVDQVLQVCLADNPKVSAGKGGDNMTCLIAILKKTECDTSNIPDSNGDVNDEINSQLPNPSTNIKYNQHVIKIDDNSKLNLSRKTNYKFQLGHLV